MLDQTVKYCNQIMTQQIPWSQLERYNSTEFIARFCFTRVLRPSHFPFSLALSGLEIKNKKIR